MKQNHSSEENGFRRLRKNLEGMTLEQKIDHIFRYYWGTILLAILIPVALGILLSPLFKDTPDLIFSGNCCNVTLDDEGLSYIINDWASVLNMEPGTLQLNMDYSDTAGTSSLEIDRGVQVLSSVAANELDYILCDAVAMEYFAVQQAFLPLDRVLDGETFSQWSDRIYTYTDPEDGTTYSAGLDVTDVPFFRDSVPEDGRVYFIFANKEGFDPQLLNLFLTHLTAWESQ